MPTKAALSVVVPTYNGVDFLRDAVTSIWQQTLLPTEIVLVDDASTDGTYELGEKLSREAPVRTRILRLDRNSGGPAEPMNAGIGASRAEYIALLDQDDRMAPTKLEMLANALGQYPAAGLAFGQYKNLFPDGTVRPPSNDAYQSFPEHETCLSPEWCQRELAKEGFRFGGAGGMAFRRSAWESIGGVNQRYRIAWDFDFAMRLVLRGWSVAYVPHTVYFHRKHDKNLEDSGGGVHVLCERVRVLVDALVRNKRVSTDYKRQLRQALRVELLPAAYWECACGHYQNAARNYWVALRQLNQTAPAVEGLLKLPIRAVRNLFTHADN